MQKKPLRTIEDIHAAYPVHKQVKNAQEKIEAVQQFLEYIHSNGLRICHRVDEEYVDEEVAEWAYIPASGWHGSFHPGGVPIDRVFEGLGLDYDAFMREKDDMIAQVRLRYDEEGNEA